MNLSKQVSKFIVNRLAALQLNRYNTMTKAILTQLNTVTDITNACKNSPVDIHKTN